MGSVFFVTKVNIMTYRHFSLPISRNREEEGRRRVLGERGSKSHDAFSNDEQVFFEPRLSTTTRKINVL